ncbi:hypothetical protein [Candidatus Endomicrobiellum agilis]|uniref:hypothetical protein n=1 Tax=Candidatus Endomicrobiellum agilis TaxID=3238957 RepID=UPI00357F6ECA|nr:hypothetical protein [Endomicrobium sp.]
MKKVIALFLIISLISGCDKQLQNGSKSANAVNTVAEDVNPQNINTGSVDKDANLKDGGKFDKEIVQIKREEQDDSRAAEAEAEARLKKKSNPTPTPTLKPTPAPAPTTSPSFMSSVWPFVKSWYVQIVTLVIIAGIAIYSYRSGPAVPIGDNYDASNGGKKSAKDTVPSNKKHRKHRPKSAVGVPPSGDSGQ